MSKPEGINSQNAILGLFGGDVHTSLGHSALSALDYLPLPGIFHGQRISDEYVIALRKMGFEFDDSYKTINLDRELFFPVKAPEGWGTAPSDHYMYSRIVDDKGRTRGQIGYKATDHYASLVLYNRFEFRWESKGDGVREHRYAIMDRVNPGRRMFESRFTAYSDPDLANIEAAEWMKRMGFAVNDPTAFWDDEIRGYICHYKNKPKYEVYATSRLGARDIAVKHFKAEKKPFEVSALLAENADGTPYVHTAVD